MYDSPVHFIRAHLLKLYYHALPLHVDLRRARTNIQTPTFAHTWTLAKAQAHAHKHTQSPTKQ